jgi:hypothetical protein
MMSNELAPVPKLSPLAMLATAAEQKIAIEKSTFAFWWFTSVSFRQCAYSTIETSGSRIRESQDLISNALILRVELNLFCHTNGIERGTSQQTAPLMGQNRGGRKVLNLHIED